VSDNWFVGCGSEADEPKTCEFRDGRVYKYNDNFPAGDGCNSCHCFGEGEVQPRNLGLHLEGLLSRRHPSRVLAGSPHRVHARTGVR
jgi:hypothetical protein